MAKEKVAVLGGNGMLGTDVVAELDGTGHECRVFDRPGFDICNEQHLRDAVTWADVIINCAAYTNVDKAESEPDMARAVNATAVAKLGEFAAEGRKYVLHTSTDFVFDGMLERPYRETDKPNPLNVYGSTKLAGEELLKRSHCSSCIMRLEWTYGKSGTNFARKLLEKATAGEELAVVDDQMGSPTATKEVARAIAFVMAQRIEGLYHYAANGYATRFDIARFICDVKRLKVGLRPVRTEDFVSPARRPLNSRFDCTRIELLLPEPIEAWTQPLQRFLEEI